VTDYPSELASDIKTLDGTTVHVRPIRPDDMPALTTFHHHLSSQSVYRRFLYVHPTLSAVELERFTTVDYVDRMALVAEDNGELIAVGRYERIPGTAQAEVAFVVADHHQHRGIGMSLLEQLADHGWHNGITHFVAQTLAENRQMLGVFRDSGFPVTTSDEHGTVSVEFPIEPDDSYRSARSERHERTERGSVPITAPCGTSTG
jgi:GNAT superfamily N-acetyltransferase